VKLWLASCAYSGGVPPQYWAEIVTLSPFRDAPFATNVTLAAPVARHVALTLLMARLLFFAEAGNVKTNKANTVINNVIFFKVHLQKNFSVLPFLDTLIILYESIFS